MMSICKSEGVGMLKARWRSCYKVKSTEQSKTIYKSLCRDLNVATIWCLYIKMQLEYTLN